MTRQSACGCARDGARQTPMRMLSSAALCIALHTSLNLTLSTSSDFDLLSLSRNQSSIIIVAVIVIILVLSSPFLHYHHKATWTP
jgi:hypothetical protein